jgi:hypothetical protein
MSARPAASPLLVLLLVAACSGGPSATGQPTGVTATPTAGQTATPAATPASPTPSASSTASALPSSTAAATPTPGADAYTWTALPIADGPPAREDHTLTLAADGASAYLFGGRSGNRAFDDLWLYDLAAGTWQQLSPEGSVPAGRFGHVAVWVDGVGLVVWSGQADAATFFDDIWAYDPDGLAWTKLANGGDVPLARYGSCGAIGPDGRLWISHGFTHDEGRFFDTKAYDFAAGAWANMTPADGDVPVLRCLHDCLWTPDGRFVLYGGQTTGVPAIGDMWTWQTEPPPGHWLEQSQPPAPPRQLYALGVLGERAFIFGGGGRNGEPLGDLWLLDLAALAMIEASPAGEAPAARSGATLVADPARERLLLFGGKGAAGELADMWQLAVAAP